ncbi:MAG: hypothetical protein RLY70_4688 [Planctomycetota bacterium]|jgi:hypothetical protein
MQGAREVYTVLYPIRNKKDFAVMAVRQKCPERDLCLLRGMAPLGEGVSIYDLPYGEVFDYCEIVDEYLMVLDTWNDKKGRWNIICNHYCDSCGPRVLNALSRLATEAKRSLAQALERATRLEFDLPERSIAIPRRLSQQDWPEERLWGELLDELDFQGWNGLVRKAFCVDRIRAGGWASILNCWPAHATIFLWATLATPSRFGPRMELPIHRSAGLASALAPTRKITNRLTHDNPTTVLPRIHNNPGALH